MGRTGDKVWGKEIVVHFSTITIPNNFPIFVYDDYYKTVPCAKLLFNLNGDAREETLEHCAKELMNTMYLEFLHKSCTTSSATECG
jgi:hypothetical protein